MENIITLFDAAVAAIIESHETLKAKLAPVFAGYASNTLPPRPERASRILDFAPNDESELGRLLRSRVRPDAIVCGNDEQAILLTETLARLGKRIPVDVAVVGFDDIETARLANPPLTTISQPVRKLAATAFKTLLARIRHPNNDPREIILDAPLVVRRST